MIGKRDKIQAVPKNSHRWGDVWRQTVPEATSSHRKRIGGVKHSFDVPWGNSATNSSDV